MKSRSSLQSLQVEPERRIIDTKHASGSMSKSRSQIKDSLDNLLCQTGLHQREATSLQQHISFKNRDSRRIAHSDFKLRTLPVIRKLQKRKGKMEKIAYEKSLIKDSRAGNFTNCNLARTVKLKHRQTLIGSLQGACLSLTI